jgi:hypothetical protein
MEIRVEDEDKGRLLRGLPLMISGGKGSGVDWLGLAGKAGHRHSNPFA